MIYETLELNVGCGKYSDKKSDYTPRLTVMVPNENEENLKYTPKRPSILILPGGAYRFTSEREAEPVAMFYLAKGYNCFILRYSVAPARFPVSLLETAYAVRLIKENAEKWFVDKDKMFVVGFSAGGHLAASYGAFKGDEIVTSTLGGKAEDYAIKGLILGYPVISNTFDDPVGGFKGTIGSFANLLGEEPDEELKRRLDLENSVTSAYPPCFIFHTTADKAVPPQTTLRFAEKLWLNNVPFELHVYENGRHGRSVGTKAVNEEEYRMRNWVGESIEWIEEHIAQ